MEVGHRFLLHQRSCTGETLNSNEMPQEAMMPKKEFVFGQYKSYQESIAFIEERTGLSFGKLKSLDTFKGGRESVRRPLVSFEQIDLG